MASISIRCTTTGKSVSTGMSMAPDSFYRSILTGNSVKCPHCRLTHIWSKSEAVFDSSVSSPQAGFDGDTVVVPPLTRAR